TSSEAVGHVRAKPCPRGRTGRSSWDRRDRERLRPLARRPSCTGARQTWWNVTGSILAFLHGRRVRCAKSPLLWRDRLPIDRHDVDFADRAGREAPALELLG